MIPADAGRRLKNTAILLVQCPDRKGLDATIADFVYRHDGNILHFEQHQAGEGTRLYLARVEWSLDDFQIDPKEFPEKFAPVAEKFSMQWRLALSSYRPRVAIFVSKYDHCLVDLLYRQRNGELGCEIALIVSNHADAKRDADFYGIPYYLIQVTKESKPEAEHQELELLRSSGIDLIVLARFIEQGVARISHRDALEDLVEKGRDLEKVVLSRAVRWHIENRILLCGNKTVIFE
jgi:formyltetrahydrofolate deformylase